MPKVRSTNVKLWSVRMDVRSCLLTKSPPTPEGAPLPPNLGEINMRSEHRPRSSLRPNVALFKAKQV